MLSVLSESFQHFDPARRGFADTAAFTGGLAKLGIGLAPPAANQLAAIVTGRLYQYQQTLQSSSGSAVINADMANGGTGTDDAVCYIRARDLERFCRAAPLNMVSEVHYREIHQILRVYKACTL